VRRSEVASRYKPGVVVMKAACMQLVELFRANSVSILTTLLKNIIRLLGRFDEPNLAVTSTDRSNVD
jgi:hypothetical protein